MSTPEEQTASATAMKRALMTMERMQRRIDEYERARSEPIAIVGMACRFPGGVVDPQTFWDLLSTGRDAIVEVPEDRWDVDAFFDERPQVPGKISCRWGGFLDRMDRFDHQFFSISRREAVLMDPQQRLFLEVTWEALEDAGQAPHSLAGSDTGVYLAIYGTDYASQVFADLARINAYSALGNLHSIAAGRVSYLLDLRGPNVAVDTACSSSLTAVHQACQGLRLGETDLAICGAVNAILSPQASISLSQLNESFVGDGRIKTFDASADGFVRGEGCGVVVLKRLSDALRDGDRPYAVIRGSAMNQDGRSAGLSAPNGASQRAMLRRALKVSGVRPEQVAFVETHGTGTKLGDPIEVDALADVYGRPDGPPVYLGAVKTNLGHLEAAAGMAGLIKTALCVERGQIPPNLHFTELSPHISFDGTTFAVPTALTPWPADAQPRVAGVSSFGLSGTNVHVIVEQAPPTTVERPDQRRPRSVLALSAKTETALVKLARRYQDRLAVAAPTDLPEVCYSANTGRAHFPYRLAAVGDTAAEVAERLGDYVLGDPGEGLALGRAGGATGSDVVFLFSGAGPQRVGMARELYETQPTFRRVLDYCDKIMQPVLGASLLSALYPQEPGTELIYHVENAVPALFAVEYALAEMWRSWGVEPVAVIGHSLGEYAAACFAGVMSLDDGLSLVAERARLLQQLPDVGAMAAIFAPRDKVAAELASHDPATIAIAAVNGPANTTVSGLRDSVAALCATFEARGVEVKLLHVPRPGHSPLVEPMLAPLAAALRQVTFAPPRIPLVSNLTGQLWPWDRVPDAEYWCRHTRQAVLFADGISTLAELGYRTFLEIGPATNLLGLAREILPPDGDVLMLPSLRPQQRDWDVLLSTVSQLYVHGGQLDWTGFDRDYQRTRVRLPRYPFDPVRCWHQITAGVPVAPNGRSEAVDPTGDRVDEAATADPRTPARSLAGNLITAAELQAIEPSARVDTLVGQLVRSVQRALGYRSTTVDPDDPLASLGLDSLMAVELRNEIQNRLGVSLTVASFLRGATIRSVATTVVAQLPGHAPPDGPGHAPPDRPGHAPPDGPGHAPPDRPGHAPPDRPGYGSAGEPGQARTGEPGHAPAAEPEPGRVADAPIRRVERVEDIAARLLAQIEDLPDEPAGPTTDAEAIHA
jgi:acyl transferase domain-containing protein